MVDTLSYFPRPVDTSTVQLNIEQEQVVESLAQNIHELWALRRLKEGWVLGPSRDDSKRTHPCIVPYEKLPSIEQDYDRQIANETLKLLILLGFQITKG